MYEHRPKAKKFRWRAVKHSPVAAMCLLLLMVAIPACKKESKEEIKTAAELRAQEIIGTQEQEPPEKPEAKELQIFVIPKDGGFTRRLEKPISISFSQAVEPKDLNFRISPDPGGWSTAWEEEGKQAVLSHANPYHEGVTYELELEVKSAGKKKTVRFTAYGPSSLELIDEDEKKGILDLDTSWTYRLQRLFEPSRLPTKYKSLTPVKCGTPVMLDFSKIQSQLKQETMDALKPYLVRPTHPESVFSRQIQEEEQMSAQKKPAFRERSMPSARSLERISSDGCTRTAVWSEDYIGEEWDTEQDYVEDAFDRKKFLLKTITLEEDSHEYGIYIFPYYLSTKYNDKKIGDIWKVCGGDLQALDAVEEVLEGNFRDVFKEFALLNYDDTSPGKLRAK